MIKFEIKYFSMKIRLLFDLNEVNLLDLYD